MTEPSATVIADSISADGHRVTTVQATHARYVLAELDTHRLFSRNGASSRAIPIQKNLSRFLNDTCLPLVWGGEIKGMQVGPPLEHDDLWEAQALWSRIINFLYAEINDYVNSHPLDEEGQVRLHKSLLNRWLETGLWQVTCITATSWDGFYKQRCDPAAEPHMEAVAVAIRDAIAASEPNVLNEGQWHLPYFGENGGHDNDWQDVEEIAKANIETVGSQGYDLDSLKQELAIQVSVARCARTSLMTQQGVRDIQEDRNLYFRLHDATPQHASPFEHVCTPCPENSLTMELPNGKVIGPVPKIGNLLGWLQFRHLELGW